MLDTFDLGGSSALITGGAGGLGAHFAETLGRAGARVVVAGRRQARLDEVVQRLEKHDIESYAVTMDVTNDSTVRSAFDRAQTLCGVIDIVVCNAGVASSKRSVALSTEEWSEVLDVNLKGCWIVGNEAARRLIEADSSGSIINISSILGHRVAGNVLPYAVSKAGLEHMTRALALEWARYGIRVNALAPGYIETELNREFFASAAGQALIKRVPQRRLGQAGDLDGALLLLASDASRYMTGSSIVVDGGHLQSTL